LSTGWQAPYQIDGQLIFVELQHKYRWSFEVVRGILDHQSSRYSIDQRLNKNIFIHQLL